VPTAGHAVAFLLASTDESFADFRAHYRQIGTVSPTYYDCTAAGALIGRDDALVSQWAQARRVTLLPRVNCQNTATLHAILTDPAPRAAWLDAITAMSLAKGYDGVTLDFEAGAAADRGAYSSFVTDLAARLHAQGDRLMVAVSAKTADVPNHPRSTFFDYKALAAAADRIFVMAWGIHWATSAPGAQDDMSWVTRVVAYVRTMPDPQRFTLGMQLYAMDWPAGGGIAHPAGAYEYADTQALIGMTGAQVRYDAAQDAMAFSYTDPFGVGHDVWYTDAITQGRRIQLARQAGLGGIGVWRLGSEDQRLWDDPALAPGVAW
jgi:spore germination protein YaaH